MKVHPHADVTAKGESVANLADIGGTITGILLSRTKFSMVPTFCVLSAGYLYASCQEVATVKLPYLNRARLAFAARTFLATGVVPDPTLANAKEPLFPWGPYGQVRTAVSWLRATFLTSRHVNGMNERLYHDIVGQLVFVFGQPQCWHSVTNCTLDG